MGKIAKFMQRFSKRNAAPGTGESAVRPGGASCPPGDPLKCIGGKLYRMRLRDGRWETFGAPLGDCKEEDP